MLTASKIVSVGSSFGEFEVSTRSILEEAQFDRMGLSVNKVEDELGISHVRHSAETVLPGDLAIEASLKALAEFPGTERDIDAVLFCGIERDYTEPATAHRIARILGIEASLCLDISDACHGFTAGMSFADLLLKSGKFENVLVCTGERSSNKTKEIAGKFQSGELGKDRVADTLGAFTVGDGGGAMILSSVCDGVTIQEMQTISKSKYEKLCFYNPWGPQPTFAMKMGKICAATISLVREMIPETLNKLHWQRDDIDLMICHQVGKRPFDKYLELFDITAEKSIATYPKLGNMASATIPICYDLLHKQGRLKRGEKIFVVSSGSGIVVTQMGLVVA